MLQKIVSLFYFNLFVYAISLAQYTSNGDSAMHSFYSINKVAIDSNNYNLYTASYNWKNTPYKMGGNSFSGIDCSHFAAKLYEKTYNKILLGSAKQIYSQCDLLFSSKDSLKEGDLIFFNIRGKQLSHVGVYLNNNYFVHATVHGGIALSNLEEDYYRKYFKAIGRFNDIKPIKRNIFVEVNKKLIPTKKKFFKKKKRKNTKKTKR